MIQCPICKKFLKTTAGLRRHITLVHKNNGSKESFSNTEITKDEFDELKEDVEDIKWALKPFIRSQKRKQQNEEQSNVHRTTFSACLDELKQRFEVK